MAEGYGDVLQTLSARTGVGGFGVTMKVLNPVLIASLLVTLVAAPAFAGGGFCESEETLATPDGALFVYVGDTVEVWEQSNVMPGLQREPCADPNGRDLPADTQLL